MAAMMFHRMSGATEAGEAVKEFGMIWYNFVRSWLKSYSTIVVYGK